MTKSISHLALYCLIGIIMTGCAKKSPDDLRVLWPAPPTQPRLEHIANYQSESDLPNKKSKFIQWFNKITGINQSDESALINPHGILASNNRIYISDPGQKNIIVFDFEKIKITSFNHENGYKTYLDEPRGLTISNDGNIFTIDSKKRAIFTFNHNGKLLNTITDIDRFRHPTSLAINRETGWIYVSDYVADKIFVYDPNGNFLFDFGGAGNSAGEFNKPHGIAFDSSNHLYVADTYNSRIQIFKQDGSFLKFFGKKDHPAKFSRPVDVAFDSEGHVYVLDQDYLSLMTYSSAGTLLLITGSQHQSKGRLGFSKPTSLFIDDNDRIYITDIRNSRVTAWQYLNEGYLAKNPVTKEDIKKLMAFLKKNSKAFKEKKKEKSQ